MSNKRGTDRGPNRRSGAGTASGHSSYEGVAAGRRASAEYREGFDEARRAYLIGQAATASTTSPNEAGVAVCSVIDLR
jgi:hypothetical protein